MSHATRRTWRSSGLAPGPTRPDRAAIRPISVCRPVACITATAEPVTHAVPLNTSTGESNRRSAVSIASAERSSGTDSPVSADASTCTAPRSNRASAGIRSPSSISSTSPGTNSLVATLITAPPRSTAARWGRYRPSASMARSACRSWIIATTALSTTTARMVIASSRASTTQASPAATHSSSANG